MGRKYFGVCPTQAVSGFLAGYDDGLRVHAAEEHRDEIRRDVRRFDQRMDDIEDELDELADRLADSGLERGERDSLEETRHHLRRELREGGARHGRAVRPAGSEARRVRRAWGGQW